MFNLFNCYENIAEAVAQTLKAVTVSQNSNRTSRGGNGSSKIDNDRPGGIAPSSLSVYIVLCLIVMKTLPKLFRRH